MRIFSALLSVLALADIRRIIQEIPDERLRPYGGPWGNRIPDVPADHRELSEIDRNVAPAAQILAPGATSVDVNTLPTDLVMHKAFRLKSSNRMSQSDMELLMSVRDSGGAVPRDRQALLNIARRHIERRMQSVRTTRGILLSAMAVGDLQWSHQGYIASMDFGMPSEMKLTPGTYWIDNTGTPDATATPISDLIAMDQAAADLGGAPFDQIDMSRSVFQATLATDEYQDQAKALSAVYNVASLPVAGSEAAHQLAARVLGKTINIVDNTYQIENADGTRSTGRYVPEKYVTLWRSSDGIAAYDFANCPLTESAVAAIAGDPTFGGDVVRGPMSYMTLDRDDFAWVRMHGTQEGTPRRHIRTATARITVIEPE